MNQSPVTLARMNQSLHMAHQMKERKMCLLSFGITLMCILLCPMTVIDDCTALPHSQKTLFFPLGSVT